MVPYGHRGAKGEAPENTLAGFAYALALGLKGIELDVRLSADGQLVVMHDDTVDRTTNGTGRVAALTAEQMRGLDARAEHLDWPVPLGVPTLHEVLDAVTPVPDLALRIEVKRDEPARLESVCAILHRLIDEYGIASRVVVSSFDVPALQIMHAAAPGLRRAFITSKDAPGSIRTAARLECASVDLPTTILSPDEVRDAHARGLTVMGWHGNSPAEIDLLLACGVDSFTTDHPTVALRLLGERGAL
jgi:glycerophosphoryl diester phosphodiesterase